MWWRFWRRCGSSRACSETGRLRAAAGCHAPRRAEDRRRAGAGCRGAVRRGCRPAAATPADMQAAIAKVIGDAKLNAGRVKLDIPPLVENGNTVPCTVTVESPMTADGLRQGHPRLQREEPAAERHQRARSGRAPDAPASPPASGSSDTQTVMAIAEMSDGSFWSDRVERHHHARRLPGGSDLMARALINVPAKAKRGEVIAIKTLISHEMETGFRYTSTGDAHPARHHHDVRRHLQRRGDLPARTVSRHRRQSVHHLPHGRHRERHHRVQLDRRQRLLGDRAGQDHGGMSAAGPADPLHVHRLAGEARSPAARQPSPWRLARAPSSPSPPTSRSPSGARATTQMSAETKAMQDEDTANPGMLWVLDGEALWRAQGGRSGPRLRRLPRRRAANA